MSRIFDHRNLVRVRQALQCIHVRTLPVKVNREKCADCGTVLQGFLNLHRVHVERLGVDIDEHRAAAGAHDRARGCEEAESGGDNLVARLHARRCQGQPERIGSGSAPHGIPCSGKSREFPLQSFDFFSKNEVL